MGDEPIAFACFSSRAKTAQAPVMADTLWQGTCIDPHQVCMLQQQNQIEQHGPCTTGMQGLMLDTCCITRRAFVQGFLLLSRRLPGLWAAASILLAPPSCLLLCMTPWLYQLRATDLVGEQKDGICCSTVPLSCSAAQCQVPCAPSEKPACTFACNSPVRRDFQTIVLMY